MLINLTLSLFSLLFSSLLFAMDNEERRSIAFSKEWLKLHFYEKGISTYKSHTVGDLFFFSKDGKIDPLAELNATITKFQSEPKEMCRFPRRAFFLKEKGVDLPLIECKELENFIKSLHPERAYIVFAGAFAGNPASLFGHTFLRFSNKNEIHDGTDLLNYSVGFSAYTNPNDNPGVYTFKGLTGGYDGFFNIKPFYENIGLYNSLEARDLYEYELPLSELEVYKLALFLFEVSENGGWPYYFFTKNCSYYLVELIAASKLDWTLEKRFLEPVLPIETVRSIDKLHSLKLTYFRPAITRVINYKMKQLTTEEKKIYSESIGSSEKISRLESIKVLDTLIDYYTYLNYKKHARLSPSEQSSYSAALVRRSTFKNEREQVVEYRSMINRDPLEGHQDSRISLGGAWKKSAALDMRLGQHGLSDNERGYNEPSYIEYLGLKFQYKKDESESDLQLQKFNLITIHSLEPFSWHVDSGYENSYYFIQGGMGTTLHLNQRALFYLLSIVNLNSKKDYMPMLRVGSKFHWNCFTFTTDYSQPIIRDILKSHLHYSLDFLYKKDHSLRVIGSENSFEVTHAWYL